MINAEVLIEAKNWEKIILDPKKIISKVLKKIPNNYKFVNKKASISVLLTNNNKIKLLNKKFRNKNKSTDILSFPFFDKKNFKKNLANKNIYLGDIVISHEDFKKKNKGDFKNGFIKIFIHGFLHLLHFDHKSNKDFKKMDFIEKKMFKTITG